MVRMFCYWEKKYSWTTYYYQYKTVISYVYHNLYNNSIASLINIIGLDYKLGFRYGIILFQKCFIWIRSLHNLFQYICINIEVIEPCFVLICAIISKYLCFVPSWYFSDPELLHLIRFCVYPLSNIIIELFSDIVNLLEAWSAELY